MRKFTYTNYNGETFIEFEENYLNAEDFEYAILQIEEKETTMICCMEIL